MHPAKTHAASASPPLRCSLAAESGANDALWRQTRHKKVLMPARSRFRGSIDECAESSGGAYGLVWGRGSFGDDCVGVRTPDGGMSFGHSDQRDGAAPYASLEGADPAAGVVEVGPAPGVVTVEPPEADPPVGCCGAANGTSYVAGTSAGAPAGMEPPSAGAVPSAGAIARRPPIPGSARGRGGPAARPTPPAPPTRATRRPRGVALGGG